MGGLAASIASAVEAADAGTKSLQVDVVHEAWVGGDALGAPAPFASPVLRKALVQEGAIHHELPDGQVITSKAIISFLELVEPNGADGRQEPIDPRDKITLPSGMTGKIREVPGSMLNPLTNAPYVRVLWLV